MENPILEALNIHKKYNALSVLKGISLKVEKNQAIAIMGASGEGKTTLLHILAGLETFDAGSLKILNNSKLTNLVRNKHIGFIFQSYNLLEDLTLLENILMPARIARKNVQKNSTTYQKAIDLLIEVNLINRKDFLAKNLSGGEKQRAAIARSFINEPDIILADEPSGNLDHGSSEIIHSLLINAAKTHKKTLIIATHDKTLADLCDKVYTLENGIFKK